MRRTISAKIAGGFLGALLVALPGAYFHYDTETENITDAVREKAGGSYVTLPQGVFITNWAGR